MITLGGPKPSEDELQASKPEPLNDLQVLQQLKDGASLRYYYMSGGVSLQEKSADPQGGSPVSIMTFLGLRERGHIATDGQQYQYPEKSQAYQITDQGRAHLDKSSEAS